MHVWHAAAAMPSACAHLSPRCAPLPQCVSVGGKDGEADWEEGQNHALIVPNDGIAAVVVQVRPAIFHFARLLPPFPLLSRRVPCATCSLPTGSNWSRGRNALACLGPLLNPAAPCPPALQVKWGGGTTLTFLDDKEAAEAFGNKRARPQKQAANGRATALVGSNKSWWQ